MAAQQRPDRLTDWWHETGSGAEQGAQTLLVSPTVSPVNKYNTKQHRYTQQWLWAGSKGNQGQRII